MTAPSHRQTYTRLVARQVSELLLTRRRRWRSVVPYDRMEAMIFCTVLSASIAHLPLRREGTLIDMTAALDAGRSIAGAAVAQSVGLPNSTVRRYAAALVECGMLMRRADGYRVGPGYASSGLADLVGPYAADLANVLTTLAAAGYAPAGPALAAQAAAPDGVVERLLLTFELRALETFVELYGDFRAGTIVAEIIAANVRHITGDPLLARRYAGESAPPPDEHRMPISLRALARAVELPFETVRRRTGALVADGVVVLDQEGAIVPAAVLLDERHLDNNRRIVAHFEQMLDALVTLARSARR